MAEPKPHPQVRDEARLRKMIKEIDDLPEAKRLNVMIVLLGSYFERKKDLPYIK